MDALTDGFKEMHLRAGEFFLDGTGAGAEAFKKLGYSAEELKTKLKDPSALMTEILGKLKGFDQAGRSFLLEEIFGGAGGEQFGALIGQSEEALNATIARAHDVGAVLDSEMIDKAAEIDRKFGELTARVESFGKRAVIAIADAAVELTDFRDQLDGIFDNEAEGRAILGNELYDTLSRDRDAVDAQAQSLQQLDGAYQRLAEEATSAGMAMRGAIGQLDAWGYYRDLTSQHGNEPGSPKEWDAGLTAVQEPDPAGLERMHGEDADRLLMGRGLAVDEDSRARLLQSMHRAFVQFGEQQVRRGSGDWSPDAKADRFPAFEDAATSTGKPSAVGGSLVGKASMLPDARSQG